MFSSCAKSVVESMVSGRTENFMNLDDQKHVKQLLFVVFWLVVTLFVGKWLWNNIATKVTTVVKPMTSIWQLLGLALLLDLVHPCC